MQKSKLRTVRRIFVSQQQFSSNGQFTGIIECQNWEYQAQSPHVTVENVGSRKFSWSLKGYMAIKNKLGIRTLVCHLSSSTLFY